MTMGEWLSSLSTADNGSTMHTVVANLEGTYPVLAPVENFDVSIVDEALIADLDIISITADMPITTYTVDFSEDSFEVNTTTESYDVTTN